MSSQYNPQEHIQHLAIAPRAEGILDQREITIQSYQTTIPFDYAALDRGIESAWLMPHIRLGVFDRTPMSGTDALHVVLGLQDELAVRAYDYDARRPIWFAWKNAIVETVGIRYFPDSEGFLLIKATGGGRRITEDVLSDFNSSFLGIPKNAVRKRDFDLQKLRKLCFERFIERLYMLRFADPSGEEYRSIEHALFQSRRCIDPEVERLHEIHADPEVRIESFEADIEIRAEELAAPTSVRFAIRGLSGSLRLKFPKLDYRSEPKTIEEQARVFYRLVDIAENSILDADYYTHLPRSLNELDVELGLFPDNVDLTQFREVLMNADARTKFFQELDLAEPWNKWQPHLRAIDELLPTATISGHVNALVRELVAREPLEAAKLLATCQSDAKIHCLGKLVADVLADQLQVVPAEVRGRVEESLLCWAVDEERDSWDVDPDTGEILVYDLRWQVSDLSLDVLPAVLWKLVGLIHARLTGANGEAGELLRRFDWCMGIAKGLPPNHSKITAPLRLVAENKVPSSIGDAAKVLKNRIADLEALDDEVMDQFGLPLWPHLVASREDGVVTLRNTGVGIARALSATPSGTLFSDKEALAPTDLCPNASLQLPVSGSPTELDVRFAKYGVEHHVRVPIAIAESEPSPAVTGKSQTDLFDWAKQIELWRATQRVLGGEDTPDKGTISKAVQAGDLESNGESGRKCRVKVDSFKAWITKTKELANDEVLQIMDAVMNEIRSRKR
ncbi:MAG: hypothetical protein JXQ75_13490 [Phycisphaerae bacterium]|nr:hypothetical protein [Phycisphaerae bacterium]